MGVGQPNERQCPKLGGQVGFGMGERGRVRRAQLVDGSKQVFLVLSGDKLNMRTEFPCITLIAIFT